MAGVRSKIDLQEPDLGTPAGKALFQMLGVFAEFEKAIMQERIHAGIARARASGTKSGDHRGKRLCARLW
jgi:DNA invertase Pin-like site-specific DNA recombinase